MTLHSMGFKTPDELCAFVTAEGIVTADIQQIWERGGTWFLFYWA